jgi:hypothetical protein
VIRIKPKRRFPHLTGPREREIPKQYRGLAEAVTRGGTIYPSRVLPIGAEARVLKRGDSNAKLGDTVAVEMWRWMPLFSLTLEERRTCPRGCPFYAVVRVGDRDFSCYGNGMRAARRWQHGPELIRQITRELDLLQCLYPSGFVIRVHVLGDFYSEDYARFWVDALHRFSGLRLFGFTARPETSPIWSVLAEGNRLYPDRCRIRGSNRGGPMGTRVIAGEHDMRSGEVVCPATQHRNPNACCAACGMCWSRPNLGVCFVAHNPVRS